MRCGGGAGGAACSCWTAGGAASSLGGSCPLAGGGEGWWRGLGVGGAGRGRRVGSGTWDAEGSLVGLHPAESNAMLLAAVACPPQMPPCVELFSLLDR